MNTLEFYKGPWLFDGRLVVPRRRNENLGLDRDLISPVPIWIRLSFLDLKLWSRGIISRIASMVGTPLYMDGLLQQQRGFLMLEYLLRLKQIVTWLIKSGYKWEGGDNES